MIYTKIKIKFIVNNSNRKRKFYECKKVDGEDEVVQEMTTNKEMQRKKAAKIIYMVRGVCATSLQSHLRTCCQRGIYFSFLLFTFSTFVVNIILLNI